LNAVRTLAVAAALLAGAVSAQATLINRGGGTIYDTELNITWLQNWNQGAGSGYDDTYGLGGTGLMTWDNARAWADNLVWGGFSDWRLPTMVDTGTAGCNYSDAGGTAALRVAADAGLTVSEHKPLADGCFSHALVVSCQLRHQALPAKEIHRRQVQCVERSHRLGERQQSAAEHWGRHLQQVDAVHELARIGAM